MPGPCSAVRVSGSRAEMMEVEDDPNLMPLCSTKMTTMMEVNAQLWASARDCTQTSVLWESAAWPELEQHIARVAVGCRAVWVGAVPERP